MPHSRVNPEYSGHLCGYVEIPANHPVHGMDYDQVEEFYTITSYQLMVV